MSPQYVLLVVLRTSEVCLCVGDCDQQMSVRTIETRTSCGEIKLEVLSESLGWVKVQSEFKVSLDFSEKDIQ